MRSPAFAIGWEFRNRHLWPLIAMAAYLLALAIARLLIGGPEEPIRLVPPDGRAAMLIAPLSMTYFYCLAVFSFGFSGDLAARQSIFPARLFTLPVRTESLVWGPMLHGTGAVAILVLAATLLARWPWEIDGPLVWPAVLAAVFLAWTQALTWMPYGLPGVRVIVTVLWLASLDAIVILAVHYNVSEPVMLAILVPQLPLAFLVARFAVARARRGDVPDWAPIFARLFRRADPLPRERDHFSASARAQLWFEWRRQGRTLPALVAILLPVELSLLWLARNAPAFVFEILVCVLFTPPFMAVFAATTMSKSNPDARDSYGVPPFMATRPLTSAALIAARLKMAIWSTLAAWLLVLLAIPLALTWSGTWPAMIERADKTIALFGMPRAIVLVLLGLSALMASTWKQLVQSLYIGLTGRAWIIRSSVIAALAFIIIIGPVAQWIQDNKDVQARLWVAVPSILAVLVALKMLAAAWVAARLAGSGLLSDRTLVTGAATWAAVVFALYGVLGWLVSGPLIPRYFLALIAILLVPLARLSAAPLALAWNRHR
jgi:hypothetical protein